MTLELFHHPWSRAATSVWALEELGEPYELTFVDIQKGEQRGAHRARNAMAKVPVLRDGDTFISEAAAILVYLADRYALGRLAPRLDDPKRGDYLRWCFFGPSVIEPACMAKASGVTHRNIARTFDLHLSEEGPPFITMELVKGDSLDKMITAGLPDVSRSLEIASDLFSALAAAHGSGVVHCDLKPSNVLIESGGRVVVTDFGIATTLGAADEEVSGTPAYMSPEQARGLNLDGRSDLFAAGILLFELLTGELPWAAESALATMLLRLQHDAPPLPEQLPPGVRELVAQLLERDPALRPARASDVCERLRLLGDASSETKRLALNPTNLPHVTHGIVGRTELVDRVGDMLREHRVLWLTGIAGVGKSVVAKAVGWSELGRLPGGVWWIDLGGVTTREELRGRIVRALRLPPDSSADELAHALAGRPPTLLVLDAAEGLDRGELDQHLATLCSTSDGLEFIVTSRLRHPERGITVGPLDVDDARELFAQRGIEANPKFEATRHREAVAQIVDQVDRLPLAIEVAAGRLTTATVDEVRESLDELAGLESVLDGSFALLCEQERRTLMLLSLFTDFNLELGWELISAVDARPDVRLEVLWEHNLLRWDFDRLRLPSPVRTYAGQRLAETPDLRSVAEAAFVQVMAQVANAGFEYGEEVPAEILVEAANLERAARLAIAQDDFASALICVRALWSIWDGRGPYDVAIEFTQLLLDLRPDDADGHGWAVWLHSGALWRAGRNEDALAVLEACGDLEHTEAWPELMLTLGCVRYATGDHDRAEDALEEAIRLARIPRTLASAESNLGLVKWASGDPQRAREHFVRSFTVSRDVRDQRGVGVALSNLALVAYDMGDRDAAMNFCREAIAVHQLIDDRRSEGIARTNLGVLLAEADAPEQARGELEGALKLHRSIGATQMVAFTEASLGWVLGELGLPDDGLQHIEIAIDLYTKMQDPRGHGIALRRRGEVLSRSGDVDRARDALASSARVLKAAGNRLELTRALSQRAKLELSEGNRVAADAVIRELRKVLGELEPDTELHEQLRAMQRELDGM